jgi:GH25 family lysozyme M1 (1,4-beta-N-acetylmuramidase)
MRISKIGTIVATTMALAVSCGSASAALAAPAADAPQVLQSGPQGIDVSHYQGVIVWPTVALSGKRFVYIKATEGNSIQDEYFSLNYTQATLIGIIRGSYHFARPELSDGATQADYFADHGGGWSNDGRTLPGALDLEGDCAGKTPASMVQWIHQFADRYKQRTSRDVVIYTTRNWWNTCTGGNGSFAATNPLWHAEPDSSPQVPNGWTTYTFWQYGQGSVLGIIGNVDLDVFNGSDDQLTRFVKGA